MATAETITDTAMASSVTVYCVVVRSALTSWFRVLGFMVFPLVCLYGCHLVVEDYL